jgi:hypothetical protein
MKIGMASAAATRIATSNFIAGVRSPLNPNIMLLPVGPTQTRHQLRKVCPTARLSAMSIL